jgi:hypothetical protein
VEVSIENMLYGWQTFQYQVIRICTNSMDFSPSRETFNCAATQELPNVLWNPKVHFRVRAPSDPFPEPD